MSLFEEKKGKIVQENFQAGRKKIYLRNKDKPDSLNLPHAYEALNYLKDKLNRYSDTEYKIIIMLPEPERKEYLSKRTAELLAWIRRLEENMKIDSVSMTGAGALISTPGQLHMPLSTSRSHNAPSVKKSKKKTKKRKKKEPDKDEK